MKASHGHNATIINDVGRIGHMHGGKSALWDDETMAEVFAEKTYHGVYDPIRCIHTKDFKYIRNWEPNQPIEDASQGEVFFEGKVLADLFPPTRPAEELFDTEADPHEIHSLAADPAYAEKLAELRAECDRWLEEIGDLNLMPETELIARLWPEGKQPVTAAPQESCSYSVPSTRARPARVSSRPR